MRNSQPRPSSPLKGNRFLTGSPLYSVDSDIGSYATTYGLVSTRGLAVDYGLRKFSPEDLPVVKQEFEVLRHVGNALIEARTPIMSPVSGIGITAQGKSFTWKPNEKHDAESKRTWIDIEKVQEQLAEGQALVEFVRYRDFDYQALSKKQYGWRPHRYAAWIVPAEGAVVHVDLGPAERIEQALLQVRQAIQSAANPDGAILTSGEPAAVEELAPYMKALSDLLLKPVFERLNRFQELIISPDGELWMVPWAALPRDDEQLLLNRFRLRFVMTGRDLVKLDNITDDDESSEQLRESQPSPPLILADPNFDMSIERVREVEQALLGDEGTHDPLVAVAQQGKCLLPQVGRLPFTRSEAVQIAKPIEAYCGVPPKVYLGEEALEVLLAKHERPRILVLGTHGFFLAAEQLPENTLRIRDPTMRCGLLLAGCNHVDDWLIRRGADGILTGYEVAALDLRGTELVVLSACDTGVGDAKNGEGVVGLRQAFQMAGAESVIASLWQLPDQDTALIMIKFFENLAAGQSKPDALRNSQLSRIKERRERYGAAHPFYWAALTLTGN